MFSNIFKRFDRGVKFKDFSYQKTDNVRDSEMDMQRISLDKAGFNIHTSVKNYMAEAVLLGGNLSATPTRIKSLIRDNTRQLDDTRNSVIVTIYYSENGPDILQGKQTKVRKTEIRIPGKMLNQGSVFIDELDCYITTESNIDATRQLIAEDISGTAFQTINVPPDMVKSEPEVVYSNYKDLVKECIKRQDKISIRIGRDLRYGQIPNIIKTFRVAILDTYFIPFKDYKLEYDPSLDEDAFVIENLMLSSKGDFRSTFTELARLRSIYLDHNEKETLFGKFYGVALFADEQSYTNYVFKRRTNERFSDETLYLAERSGDPRLKEEISRLEREVVQMQTSLTESADENIDLKARNKALRQDLREREEALTKIRNHHDAKMSAEAILGEIEVEVKKIDVDNRKLDQEQEDLKFREKIASQTHRAAMLKNVSDMMKSGWGITTAILGGIVSIAALCKKYNIKLTMGK